MSKVLQHKVVAALPSPLEPDSIYYVRAGAGFDIHVTNGVGVVTAYSLNANLELDGKVDKELGYSLLPNTEITRLATIHTGATKNRADSENADKLHTHTTDDIADMSSSGKGVATGTPAQGRSALLLGTAATRDSVTDVADSTEDRTMITGSGGWMSLQSIGPPSEGMNTSSLPTSLRVTVANTPGSLGGGVFLQLHRVDGQAYQLHFYGSNVASRQVSGSTFPEFSVFYTSTNTAIDPDGTLKASSPVINLYTDKHDLHNESQFGATPLVTRKSKGVYEITGTLGLRSEGWYLDTPSDRNGNKYFNIEWTQNITPDAADGVVDEYRDDIVVTIETFERVWNKETGVFENGAPMDINEFQDRFVQLRFNEIKVEHEELMNENK